MSRIVSILFAGDFAPCRGYESLTLEKGEDIFGDLKDDILKADVAFLNLEAPLCKSDKALKKSGPNLKADPDCIKAVVNAGFNVVGLANNHVMDYGDDGLIETLSACKGANIKTCGAGLNITEAQEPLIVRVGGLKIAFIAITEHEFSIADELNPGSAPLDPIDNIKQIEQVRGVADLVFVTIHGGNEFFSYPRPGLRRICKFLIERGVDGVICHHPHVPGAYEFYNEKPIFYSLGNLIFDHDQPPTGWHEGYAVNFKYDVKNKKLINYELIPYNQSISHSGLVKLKNKQKDDFLSDLFSHSKVLLTDVDYLREWEYFCNKRENSTLLRQYFPFNFKGLQRLSRFFNLQKIYLPKSSVDARKNMIQCESHRELLLSILGKK